MATKRCGRCKEHLPVDEFNLKVKSNPAKGLASYCKQCFRDAAKESARKRKPDTKDRKLRSLKVVGKVQTCQVRGSVVRS